MAIRFLTLTYFLVWCINPVYAQTADSLVAAMSKEPDTIVINALNKRAVELSFNNLIVSKQMAERALEKSLTSKYRKGEGTSLNLLSLIMLREGKFDDALKMKKNAEAVFESISDHNGLADVYNTAGLIYSQEGKYPLAVENYTKALKIRQALNQTDQIPKTIENIAIIHFRQGDYDLALQYFKECLDTYKAQGNEPSASKILVNIGATYNKLKMPEKALEAHQQSLSYFEKMKNIVGMGIARNNIGSVYFAMNDFQKAIDNYTKSLDLKRRMNDNRGIAVSLSNIAEAYMMLNNLSKARENIDQSLKISERIGSKEQMKDAYEMLAKIYEKGKDYQDALKYERKMVQMKDSLFSKDKTEQISRMRAIYETEKAEQQARLTKLEADFEIGKRGQQRNVFIALAGSFLIAALFAFYLYRQKQKSNGLLSEKNTVIEKSLRERETLLKEIHHRVKNNLQIISSLLSLQSRTLQDADAQGAISESRNRVKSMSLIHEQLYQDDTISGVDMKDYIQRLANSLASSYGLDTERVKITINADAILLDVDSAIPLGLIMNELVSNAIKYAFPASRSGAISISLKEKIDELQLVVQDNGVGFDRAAKGTQSFGLNMVNSLMRKLNAEIKIISSAGTMVALTVRDFRKVTFTEQTASTG